MGKENKKSTGREKVYSFLVEFMKENGYSPSIREICDGTDFRSTSTVHAHLAMLELLGKIEMKPNSGRAIRLVGYKLVKEREN